MSPENYEFAFTMLGHSCVDITAQEGDPGYERIKPGVTHVTEEPIVLNLKGRTYCLGGSTPNAGIVMARQLPPHSVAAVTVVGTDNLADAIRGGLVAESMNVEGIIEDATLPHTSATLKRQFLADRGFDHYEGHNRFLSTRRISRQVIDNIISRSAGVHHGYPNLHYDSWKDGGAGFLELMSLLDDIGVTKSIDFTLTPDLAPMTNVIYSLQLTDIFSPNCDEAMRLAMPVKYARLKSDIGEDEKVEDYVSVSDLREMTDFFLDLGVKIVTIKLGGKGLYMRTGSEDMLRNMGRMSFDEDNARIWAGKEYWSPSFNVDLVDSSAAGDAAVATILAGIYLRYDPITTLTLANYIGACCVRAPGLEGVPAMRDGKDQLGKIDFERNPLQPGPDWKYEEGRHVYIPSR